MLSFPGRIPLTEGFQVVRQRVGVDFTDSDPFWCDPVTAQGQGNLAVVMGPLEGVRDALGLSQRVATTRVKDWGAVISCFKNIYHCAD